MKISNNNNNIMVFIESKGVLSEDCKPYFSVLDKFLLPRGYNPIYQKD